MNIPQRHRHSLLSHTQGSPIVVTAYDATQLSGDMAAPFLQEASFWWLTGIDEPGWKLIVDASRGRSVLVRPERSETQRLFDGETADTAIRERSGADEIIELRDFERYLRDLARKHPLVYTVYDKTPHEFVLNPAQRVLHETLSRTFTSVEDIGAQVHELRAIKSDDEIRLIKKAITLTAQTFRRIRTELTSYKHEYELEAEFTKQFRSHNAVHAYEPIVASAANAVTLHYVRNDANLAHNKLVLIDVGARVEGYCADITRTYAVNPTKRQRAVHSAVESAHKKIIALLGPDVLIVDYLSSVDEIMKDALIEVGLLKDRSDAETYRRYFPHAISHGLGVDVHDSLGAPRYFRPGMVVTVEPGLYIPEEGIGVRIEDDILITTTGHENLSAMLSTAL